jgi:hypothetical protein
MNISDYSTKVKNLANALVSIRAPVDDEDLVAVTLNGLGKVIARFVLQLQFKKHFPIFKT